MLHYFYPDIRRLYVKALFKNYRLKIKINGEANYFVPFLNKNPKNDVMMIFFVRVFFLQDKLPHYINMGITRDVLNSQLYTAKAKGHFFYSLLLQIYLSSPSFKIFTLLIYHIPTFTLSKTDTNIMCSVQQ